MAYRVSKPLLWPIESVNHFYGPSEMAITLELKLCLSNFSMGITKQEVIKVQILNFHASYPIFDRFC